jgi:hypothetical protein
MRLGISLEPPGPEADNILRAWLETFSLAAGADNLVEVGPASCFDLLAGLRNRCYERGLTINVKFYGKED